jgi:exonuclease SbcC
LEIMVFNGRYWRRFESFSGGQRYRIASSMRLALARLLAHRSGAQIDFAFLDEPEGLDFSGRQYLIRILEGLGQELGLVLLASHHTDLKDALPSQINFTLDDEGLSHVEVVA